MADPPSRLAAALADRYQLERELGQGGMATVYLAEGPTYQNFRFTFNVRRDTLYFVLADRQSDLWMAEMLPR